MEALRLNNPFMFSQEQSEFLDKAAKRYIWWMTKEEAMLDPFFVISQVMNLGDINDSAKLFCIFDHKILRQVLLNAKAGWFSDKRSWGTWNNLLFSEHVFVTPAMPVRKIPDWDSL
jgi:hypothetical protein